MTVIGERLRALQFGVVSPDRAVSGTYSGAEGLKLRLDRDIADYRDEESLAETVEDVLIELTRTLAEERRAIVSSVFPRMATAGEPLTRAALRRQVVAEQIGELTAQGRSPRGWVNMERTGHHDYLVAIRDGAIAKLGSVVLAAEIMAAYRDVMAKRRSQIAEIRDREYISNNNAQDGHA